MPSGRAILLGSASLAVAVAVVLLALSTSGPRSGAAAPRQAAPALPRQVLAGRRVDLAALRGRPVVVNFWASWCAPCRREAPQLQRFSVDQRGTAQLVGVDWGDGASGARAFVRRYRWTFPVLRDSTNDVGNRFGLTGLPTTYVLDARGRVAQTLRGPQTEASLTRAVVAAGS
jgi:cytochrome c biogenesis protein CcmG/thiol:disulfide interchange protein DsbE